MNSKPLPSTSSQIFADNIQKMHLSFENIHKVLSEIEADLEITKDKSIVMGFGYTGSGKSTLFGAMADGSKSLEMKELVDICHR